MNDSQIKLLLSNVNAVRRKEPVFAAIIDALQPGKKSNGIFRFVEYFFACEKKADETTLTEAELSFIFDKCKAAVLQPTAFVPRRQKKLYMPRDLKKETTIGECQRTHADHSGVKEWVPGWLTTYSTDAHVELVLTSPVLVTRMMVHAVNVKASPCAMQLSAKDANGEWTVVRDFYFRIRDYEGSHGNEDYSKMEMFYVVGHAANQGDYNNNSWEGHPLAGPGKTPVDGSHLYIASKHWRWSVVDSNGAGYVGINDFHLYGYDAAFPAPTNVKAVANGTGAKISWQAPEDKSRIVSYRIVAYPSNLSHRSTGGFYEDCDGKESTYLFSNLSPGMSYQFQVLAVDGDGNEGIPSSPSEKIRVSDWNPLLVPSGVDTEPAPTNSEPRQTLEPVSVEERYDPTRVLEQKRTFSNVDEAFDAMANGNFSATHELKTSNAVTLYISGCLEDTDVERNYVSKYVIPKLKSWCNANGYDFSGIDLRWGLTTEVANDHKTYSIHMGELERSFQNSATTVFYFISGEKYGTTLLPEVISKRDREAIYGTLKDSTRWVMDVAYVQDKNGDPPVYKLQKISDIEARGKSFWDTGEERGVHFLLKEIMTVMRKSDKVSAQFKEWQPSLAIAECLYALRETDRSQRHKFMLGIRTFDNLYKAMQSESDYPEHLKRAVKRGCTDLVERQEITNLRQMLVDSTNDSAEYAYSFDWKTHGIDISCEDVSMKQLCCNLYSEAKRGIEDMFTKQRVYSEVEQEMIHHATFVEKRSSSFYGRIALLKTVFGSIPAADGMITVVHGVSGAGKTSVMCVAASKAGIYLDERTVVVARLCGTSPMSSSAKGIMKSICSQLHVVEAANFEAAPESFDELVPFFHGLLEKTATSRPVAVFIDSLDQLSDEDAGRSQPWKWIPKLLPNHVTFVVSTLPDTEYGILQALSEIHPRMVEVPLVPPIESDAILNEWMKERRRTLTAEQREIVSTCLDTLQSGISMLHLRLICDRVCQWDSRTIRPTSPPTTVQGMIDHTYEELERVHGVKLVSGFLSLLVASKEGLSTENVEDILSADEEALGGAGQSGTILARHNPPVRRVPPFLLARFKYDLRDYLVERGANGMRVLGLYHRQFIEAAQKRYLSTTENRKKALTSIIEYFTGESANKFMKRQISFQPFWYLVEERSPNKQKIVELPHALLEIQDHHSYAKLITEFDYIEAKCAAGGVYVKSLMQDYLTSIAFLESFPNRPLVQSFFRFVSTWFHVLHKNPSCLTTLALNYAPGNPVTLKMEDRWKQKLCNEEAWIKWNNAPKALDPCIFTNVFTRAGCITALKSGPDAKYAVVGGDSFCGVYDFSSYQLQGDFGGHTSWIRGICFSPDGRYVLSVSNDTTGRVWNVKSTEQCSELRGHLCWVLDCDWSPQDHIVVTASEDGTARLWNPYLGDCIGVFGEHGVAIKGCVFAPTGLGVVTGDVDGKLMHWSVPSCEEVSQVDLKESINCVKWGREADMIAAATAVGSVVLLNPELKVLRQLEGFRFPVNSCFFAPDGKELVAAGAEHVGHVYNLESGEVLGQLVGHSRQITCVDWIPGPHGGYLLTGSEDQTMRQWQRSDVIPGDVFEAFAEDSWKPTSAFALGFTKDGDLYGIDGTKLMNLFRCRDILGKGRNAPFLEQYATGLEMGDRTCGVLSPDGETWAVCAYGQDSVTMSCTSGTKLKSFNQDVCHNTLAWDPSGSPKFFASGHGQSATLWNTETDKEEAKFDIDSWVWKASWSSDGRFLAVSCDGRTPIYNMDEIGSDVLTSVAEVGQSMRCALNSNASRLAIIGKTGEGYESAASTGHLYNWEYTDNVVELKKLAGSFEHAQNILFTSDDRFCLVSFAGVAFGSTPSICAYDSECGDPLAWYVSPINQDFVRMAVPYQKTSDFVAVDKDGKIFVLSIEEL